MTCPLRTAYRYCWTGTSCGVHEPPPDPVWQRVSLIYPDFMKAGGLAAWSIFAGREGRGRHLSIRIKSSEFIQSNINAYKDAYPESDELIMIDLDG